jgi:translation initiation factor 2 alpha subunit (eIF-2alpha)
MIELKPEQLVVAEVVELGEFGAMLRLEDYDKQAFLHVSEVPSRRGRKAESNIRIRSKIVVRVIREDRKSGRVFVSLKQISKEEAKTQMRLWKERGNAISIIQKASEGIVVDEALIQKMERKAIEKHGSLANALRIATEEGSRSLMKIGVPQELCDQVVLLAKKELVKKETRIRKRLKILFTNPNGVDLLKKAISDASGNEDAGFFSVRSQAPPLYYLTAYGPSPKIISIATEQMAEKIVENVRSLGGYAEIIK